MNGLSKYYQRKAKDNMLRLFELATRDQKNRGLNWYPHFYNVLHSIGDSYGIDGETIVECFSALSPRNKLDQNIKDTITVVEAYQSGLKPSDVKVCTFNSNKDKAFEALKGKKPIKKTALKTYSFKENCLLNADFITADTWHILATLGEHYGQQKLTRLRYEQLTSVTIETALELGLKGYELQAIVWNVIREKDMTQNQIEKEKNYVYESFKL